jgi:diguanylate cyclase
MISSAPHNLLSRAVDDYIDWLLAWSRIAFLDLAPREQQAETVAAPASFFAWLGADIPLQAQDQPALEQLENFQDQLHTLARLVVMKTGDGQPIAPANYESVIVKYQQLMQNLRRFECAFATAASGLDPLTGLRSRIGLNEDLQREYSRFQRTGKHFSIAIMDVDFFKKINDTYGHDAGDHVLAAVADHVSRGLRGFDDAYRFGGEEFLLFLKEADADITLRVLERLRSHLEKTAVRTEEGQDLFVTASFGFVVSAENLRPEEMLKRADHALYTAKNEGRNKIVQG